MHASWGAFRYNLDLFQPCIKGLLKAESTMFRVNEVGMLSLQVRF